MTLPKAPARIQAKTPAKTPEDPAYRCRFCGIAYYNKSVTPCCCSKAASVDRCLAIEAIVKQPLTRPAQATEQVHCVDVHSAAEWLRGQIRTLAGAEPDLAGLLDAKVQEAFSAVYSDRK